jgi:hypothetical protein
MRRSSALVLALLSLQAMLALAGCTAEAPAPGPVEAADAPAGRTSAGSDVEGVALGAFNATGCEGRHVFLQLPAATMRPELPEGYEMALIGDSVVPGEGVALAFLTTYRCASLQVANATADDVGLAVLGVVMVGQAFYHWEIFVDEPAPALQPLLASSGWDARAATITVTGLGAAIEAGDVRYTVDAAGGGEPGTSPTHASTAHTVGPAGHRWLAQESWASADGVTTAGALVSADGGTLGRIQGRVGSPALPGHGPLVNADWSAVLYREAGPETP